MINIELIGTNEAVCGDLRIKTKWSKSPLGPMCRALVASGHDGDEIVNVYRGEMQIFMPRKISSWARQDATETDRRAVRCHKWVENPFFSAHTQSPQCDECQ